ncbi:nicotinate-nucleotide--dimethylbenzimidazole phosphoribosyltransferase [Rhodococcus sp. IEGM 1408]|uniref:nicotinate-nucleotide--dimethylbenzimidazole phosphoribosyltransferase n=1 Tax=Rhodococcus sp. IEGM 1408 TaxID=3082220 RepID=UPI0029531908|nr:nicotinate-nucleotide--dimethylbenzimidazole phosphoribosyltransferase [Rhodococcus sp. IEGM 1408]MDV8002993.1 nicotinate-nucleotide--dimethylbenzimidazole phosphoribosyltransferase [Rhodococcus sp. IEGM 1408]
MTPTAPSAEARTEAAERLAGLAVPSGALGRLGELAIWLAGVQGMCPPWPVTNVRAVVFAGDHGVTEYGVSAYPKEITPAMVRAFLNGGAGVAVLAEQHDVALRILDIGVDDNLEGVDPAVKEFKIGRSCGPIHLEDAISRNDCARALIAGRAVARQEIAAGSDLLISGDMGIGNTTPAAALIAAYYGFSAAEVTGRGTGIDEHMFVDKQGIITQALNRVSRRMDDPTATLAALGSADIAASAGFMIEAAAQSVPVLLDGVIAVASAVAANAIAPGSAAWFAAGHRSPEPAQSLALDKLGMEPLLDLGMRLGEGSGAIAAVPLIRSAALLLDQVLQLSDLGIS